MEDKETTKTIAVSLENWRRLSQIKIDDNLGGLDDAINKILDEHEKKLSK